MQHPTLRNYVTRADESLAGGASATHIPTFGAVATSFDAYRTVGVESIRDKPASWCMTDTDAAAALGRIVDGPITSGEDLRNAEIALRAILLHEYVEVLVPCAKAQQSNGFVHYLRLDKNERSQAAFNAFGSAPNRDVLLATEFVQVNDGIVVSSTDSASQLVGMQTENAHLRYRAHLKRVGEIAFTLPIAIDATTCYSSEELRVPTQNGGAGFIDEMYRRIYKPWMEVAQASPPTRIDVKLPPLLAILLSRTPSRERIPEILKELREQLSNARAELNGLNEMLERTLTQAEIQAQTRRVNESFDAIVPEALLTGAERRSRRIASIFNFARPLRQLYSIAIDPLAVDREKFLEMVTSMTSAVKKDSRIISRSVAAGTLAELLRVESVRQTVLTQFTPAEVELISRPAH